MKVLPYFLLDNLEFSDKNYIFDNIIDDTIWGTYTNRLKIIL